MFIELENHWTTKIIIIIKDICFVGFVGLFNLLFLWPLFFLLHYSHWELFEWPNKHQWTFLLINGLVGTVLSEVLWLWWVSVMYNIESCSILCLLFINYYALIIQYLSTVCFEIFFSINLDYHRVVISY